MAFTRNSSQCFLQPFTLYFALNGGEDDDDDGDDDDGGGDDDYEKEEEVNGNWDFCL